MQTKMKQRLIGIFLCCVLLLGVLSGITPSVQAAPSVATSYYGREQLAQLNNASALLYAYDQIVAGVESAAEQIQVYDGTNTISTAELETVMDAYLRDHTEHFWIGDSYTTTSSGGTCRSIKPKYSMTGAALKQARTAFDNAVNQILSGLNSGMSELERELYLHDKLASIITYANGNNAHNAYGAIVEKTAVCEGYAKALQYLLQRAGIQSFIVNGHGQNPSAGSIEPHAWNYVRINGKYYHVDLTWNDQGNTLFHAYFNQTDRVILEDHAISATNYPLPSCTATDAMYFTGKDTFLDSYDIEKLAKLLKDNHLQVHVYIPDTPVSEFWQWLKQNISSIARKAQVSGSYTYGYRSLGKELVLSITPMNSQPTQPESTEPTPTEPKPTEPKPTEPKPTEPKPTEPKPTEPKPTEPKPTEPPVTEPSPTQSQVTEPQGTESPTTGPSVTEPPVTESQVTEPTAGSDSAPTDSPVSEDDGSKNPLLIALPIAAVAACAVATPILLRRKRN